MGVLLRIATLVGLVWWGMTYVAHATELVQFVLECMVLVCILRFDEIFLYLFGSPVWQNAVRTLDLPSVRNPARSLASFPLVTCCLGLACALLATLLATR